MNFKLDEWVKHPKYGDGQITADLGDKCQVQFVTAGERLMLKTSISLSGQPPYPGFSFAKRRTSGTPRFRVVRVVREPAPPFEHLVKRFLDVFEEGFESENFDKQERQYKLEAADLLRTTLNERELKALLDAKDFPEVSARASRVVHRTNLIFRNEMIQFNEALRNTVFQQAFATGLAELLYGTQPEEERFTCFADILLGGSVAKWTIATYFQFLQSGGELMYMKPAVVKKMADSLNIALNYSPAPNWLTYCKLQELAARVRDQLVARGLKPRSGIDTQGFIWASIKIDEGKYGSGEW
ncbi:MAG: hypothetical protein ABR881_31495 [Candidatus Sulfotelmatobacter sp.]|jgi:hypothetical protein